MLLANLTPKSIIFDYLVVMEMFFWDLYFNGILFHIWDNWRAQVDVLFLPFTTTNYKTCI